MDNFSLWKLLFSKLVILNGLLDLKKTTNKLITPTEQIQESQDDLISEKMLLKICSVFIHIEKPPEDTHAIEQHSVLVYNE